MQCQSDMCVACTVTTVDGRFRELFIVTNVFPRSCLSFASALLACNMNMVIDATFQFLSNTIRLNCVTIADEFGNSLKAAKRQYTD